ncbi:nitroreductase family deazaflavin-dependent oxidoreductase [Phycicoccus sp.]|uniref:nitroreductase family deazaflavin-dependent oxidoreductase n=1 Tax=Phycicoccus sp. TaxID=1902410 RepID=UPI002D0805F8|nr:nitroreductase family deazaflavin-dependent oxidoreductase [Phycicoccus sp.]HMM93789.1 nitroreductase family deazaflavin-dependent oxidoreductase [Phycicoccus sp.]
MGIAADLGYVLPRPNAGQRAMQAVGSTRAGAWVLARVLPATDRGVARLTRGRTTLSGGVSGLPTLVLSTTGRRSGRVREAQLIGVPVGDGLALLGTNFGQNRTPTWVLNLEADPRASVSYRGVTCDVVARAVTEAERPEVLGRAVAVYPGYARYLARVRGREVRVLILERADQ